MSWNYYGFKPYVPVADRRRNAAREMAKLGKKGMVVRPVQIDGRTIAATFWGKAWCENLESYMDYANRLPRGRTYVRNGSVVHLDISPGKIEAMVSGSELYKVTVSISAAAKQRWKALCTECAGGIGSLVELLQGRFSDKVMGVITRRQTGLFPAPNEIKMDCSCPDWAGMCKHIAAVLYGIGARLDEHPELLFLLRSVNHEDLITQAAAVSELTAKAPDGTPELAESELGAVFGIELDTNAPSAAKSKKPARASRAESKTPAPVPTKQETAPAERGKAPRPKPARRGKKSA